MPGGLRIPTRRSRSAEHSPAARHALPAREQRPGGTRGHHPRWDRLRDRIPTTRGGPQPPSRPTARDARIRQRHGLSTDYPLKAICAVERMDIGLWRWPGVGWRTAPDTLISSEVIVWRIVALRVNVPGWSAHADGGSGVVAGVAETPWTGSATRDAVKHRDAASGADAGLDGRGESP